ncbi:hypothetical protein ACFVGM_33130 [Kitasatospora purpeofusca]|uniref:hypothetical protein n=1 Tax=Kitasatospora purpeofusca TaxID=67352 RepID=UPI0036C0CA9A
MNRAQNPDPGASPEDRGRGPGRAGVPRTVAARLARLACRWPIADAGEVEWLARACGNRGPTAYLPRARPDAAWVLHAMYVHESGPGGTTGDAHSSPHRMAGDHFLPDTGPPAGPADALVVGGRVGRTDRPGPEWHRLRWAEQCHRTGEPPVPEGLLPSLWCFTDLLQTGSWPPGIASPSEGSMDRDTWQRLTALLVRHGGGPDLRCLAYYSPMVLMGCEREHPHVREGLLGDASVLYDTPDTEFTPSNLWAEDRSWVLATDCDLMATKVVGPPALIESLVTDGELEAVRLPWAH